MFPPLGSSTFSDLGRLNEHETSAAQNTTSMRKIEDLHEASVTILGRHVQMKHVGHKPCMCRDVRLRLLRTLGTPPTSRPDRVLEGRPPADNGTKGAQQEEGQVGTSVCKTLLPGPGMRVWTRWFSRNTVYNVTVYLLMRIARSTPASADEPIYLLPRSTGPNRKPRSRRPIGVQPGNMQGDPLPCMRAGRTERLHTNEHRVF